jgi:hypothetical protein
MNHTVKARFAALPLLLLALALTLAAQASAAPDVETFTLVENIPYSTGFTGCDGQTFTLEGKLHQTIHVTADETSGHITVAVQETFHVRGTNLATGTQYVANQTLHVTHTTAGPFPAELTSTGHITLVSRDGTPNFYIRTVLHQTVNANGEMTSDQLIAEEVCR